MILKLSSDRLLKNGFEQDVKTGTAYSQEARRLYELDNEYKKQGIKLARMVRYQKQQASTAS